MTTEKNTPPANASANASATTSQDDFEAAFAEITKEDGHDAAKPAADAAAVAAVADQGAGAGSADAAGGAEGAAAAAVATDAAAGDAAADASGEGKPADDAAAQLAAAQARIAELEAAAAVAAKEPAKPAASDAADPAAAAPAEPEVKWYAHSDEEKTLLAGFKTEWPEVDAAMQVAIRAAVYNTVQYTYAQIAKQYGPQMTRFGEVADEVEEFMALQTLRGANSDYDNIRDKVVQWVGTLPGFQKRAADMTLEQGTPDEVNELIAEYKKANPAAAPVATAGAAPAAPVAKGKTELSAAAKKAAGKLSVVDSKRTSDTTAAADPSDFDAAWREATAS